MSESKKTQAPLMPDTIAVWNGTHAPLSFSRVEMVNAAGIKTPMHRSLKLLPGDNVVDRAVWEMAKSKSSFQRLMDTGLLGEGRASSYLIAQIESGAPAPKSWGSMHLARRTATLHVPRGAQEYAS